MFVDAEARKKWYDINFPERDSATWESSLTKVQCAVRQIAVQDTRATRALQHFSASVLRDKDREQLWRLTCGEEEDHWRCCQKQCRAAEQKVEASPCEDRSHYWRAKEAMSEAYTRYVQRIAAVDAFLREQEAPEELQLRVVQVQRCATVSRQIRVIEAAAQVGNQTLQQLRRDTDANVKTANDVQVRALVRASDKRPQGPQTSEPQEFNMVWDNGYSPERAQWVYKQFGRPVPRMWHYCRFCKQRFSSAAKYDTHVCEGRAKYQSEKCKYVPGHTSKGPVDYETHIKILRGLGYVPVQRPTREYQAEIDSDEETPFALRAETHRENPDIARGQLDKLLDETMKALQELRSQGKKGCAKQQQESERAKRRYRPRGKGKNKSTKQESHNEDDDDDDCGKASRMNATDDFKD